MIIPFVTDFSAFQLNVLALENRAASQSDRWVTGAL